MRPGPRRGAAAPERPPARGALARFRVALRIARRSSLRSPGRSALIVALIALPVAGMAAVTLVIASTAGTDAEKLAVQLGQTQASVQVVADAGSGVEQDPFSTNWTSNSGGGDDASAARETQRRTLDDLFPAGTAMIPVRSSSVILTTRGGTGAMNVVEGETWDPSLAGAYDVVAGRVPSGGNEVLATAGALDRLGAAIGDSVQLVSPAERTVTVVGEMDDRSQPSARETLFGLPAAFGDDTHLAEDAQASAYLPDTVLDWPAVRELNAQGAVVLSRDVFAHPPKPGSYLPMSGGENFASKFMMAGIIVGFALLEVLLLAGAAFMVGARAQERSLATAASVGAPRSTLLAVITGSGLVLGAVGGVAGVAAGIGIGAAFMTLSSDGSATQYWGFHLWWPAMIGIALAAIVVGWLGALVPAVRASRIDIVAALRGARKPAPARRRRPLFGALLVIAGALVSLAGGGLFIATIHENPPTRLMTVATTVLLVGGPVVIQFGLILCSGLVLRTLARLFSHGGVAARLASRDAARNPGRSVPALAVVMTTVFAAVFAMAMIGSSQATSAENYMYRAQLGQVRMPLAYWNEHGEHTIPSDAVVSAARSSLDLDTIATLRSVADPRTLGGSTDPLPAGVTARTLLPFLTIPAAQQCPADYGSVNYDPESENGGSVAAQKAAADWRCQDTYVRLSSWSDGGQIWVGDANQLAQVLGTAPSAAAKRALADGGAVALHPQFVQNGRITVAWWPVSYWQDPATRLTQVPATRSKTVHAVVQKTEHPLPYGVFISPATARSLGLDYEDSLVLASTTAPATQEQIDGIASRVDVTIGVPGSYYPDVERGPARSAGSWSWALLGLAGVIAIGAAAVAIGLARADGRRDQAALSAVGASPRIRRGFGFWQAIVLTGIGSVLGAVVGLVPALALTLPGSGTTFHAPWLQIGATAVLMPLAIAVASWLFVGRSRVGFRRAAIE